MLCVKYSNILKQIRADSREKHVENIDFYKSRVFTVVIMMLHSLQAKMHYYTSENNISNHVHFFFYKMNFIFLSYIMYKITYNDI